MTHVLKAAPAVDLTSPVNMTTPGVGDRCSAVVRYVALIGVNERVAIARRQGAVLEIAVIGGYLRDVHLLEIAASGGGPGKSEIDLIRSAKVLGNEIARQRAAELSIDPILQRVSLCVPNDVGLVPASVFEVAESDLRRKRLKLRSRVRVDKIGRVGSTR